MKWNVADMSKMLLKWWNLNIYQKKKKKKTETKTVKRTVNAKMEQ